MVPLAANSLQSGQLTVHVRLVETQTNYTLVAHDANAGLTDGLALGARVLASGSWRESWRPSPQKVDRSRSL